jgi:hypothetical protein
VIGLQDNIPSLAAIAAVRTTFRDELLPPEANAAAPSITGLNKNVGFINEH